MKECIKVQRMLSRYLDGESLEPERSYLELHLGGCPECRKELAGISQAKKIIISRERKALPADYLIERLRRSLAEQSLERMRFSLSGLGNFSRRLIPVPVAAIALSILLLVVSSASNPSLEDKLFEGGRVSSDTAVALILGVQN